MAASRGRSKKRSNLELSPDNLPLRSSGRQAKKKAVEIPDEDEDGSSEKKYRKCEKAGCTAAYPVCFASASERCAKNGYTSRWYHLSCGEHFCNECFDHYYRSHKDGYDKYSAWKRVWTSNGKTEPSPKAFMADQQLPYWVQCTKPECGKWRQLTKEIQLTPHMARTYRCGMKPNTITKPDTPDHCSFPEDLVFVKCHFDYNPFNDNLIPCKEAGLKFSKGEILQIVNREDPNWWQASHVKEGGSAGLIPSQFLEEKRKAFVRRDWDNSGPFCGTISNKKKKKMMYLTTRNAEFDRHEIQIYEEVAKMPPFQRKTLVLIGAQGVGRRSLKNRFIVLNPARFGTTVPFTSRKPREDEKDGQAYKFVSRSEMEADIKAGKYLEHGEYEGNLYGTKIDSILEVVQTGRTCILDVNPQALKVLRTSEFMPYVVFIAAPELETLRAMHKAVVDAGITTKLLTDSDLKKTVDESARIQRAYNHYFDLIIVNDNLDKAFEKLQTAIEKLRMEPQWVPISWVY